MRKAKTHFEQVPIAVVEKLLEKAEVETDKRKESVGGKMVVKRVPVKTEPYSIDIAEVYSVHIAEPYGGYQPF